MFSSEIFGIISGAVGLLVAIYGGYILTDKKKHKRVFMMAAIIISTLMVLQSGMLYIEKRNGMRQQLLQKVKDICYAEYALQNDGIPGDIFYGLKDPSVDCINNKLKERGENWEYVPGAWLHPKPKDGSSEGQN